MITLILGGARSGKSSRALQLARRSRKPVYFLATAEPADRELRRRIALHRRQRPASWRTIEESRRIPQRLAAVPRGATVIVDCLTLWIGRLTSDRVTANAILHRTEQLCRTVRARRLRLIAVSNEVGSGVVPPTQLGRSFQDVLGQVNQRVAAAAQRVELMVAGLPLRLK